MVRSQREEIQKYRWIESERVGEDIGFARAEREWKQKHYRSWREWMRSEGLLPGVVELIWTQQEEIEKFKWAESERRGYDIGWARACQEWQQKHYGAWREHILGESPAKTPPPRDTKPHSTQHREKLSSSMKTWWATRRASTER